MNLLTIAIPTYNRFTHLRERLQELIPQLVTGVSIHVYDNASTDETDRVVADYNHPAIEYRRSTGNLGMCGNFIRCFVTPQSKWLWILGDDDPVQPDALERILRLLGKTKSQFVSFTTNCNHNVRNEVVNGLENLLGIKDTTSLMHISANLYRISHLRESFKILTPSAFTFAPNVAIIFHALQSNPDYSIELSTEEFLSDGKNPRRWSCMEVSVGLSMFPLFVTGEELQRKCALGLRVSTRWMLLWALGEINPEQEMKRWRQTVRLTNENLSLFGATFPRMLRYAWKHSRRDFRREVLIQLISRLPLAIFRLICTKMKKKTKSRRDLVASDFV